ncbi:hypothetical protein Scep_029145 [Stephania cephalantha]|uniref:Uncharacterized protein n=1 Tax=Stephania cephalantha TaxID=152367 RepID=A0AAP0E4Q6_9MAGN
MLRLLSKQRRQPLITWTAARFSSTAAAAAAPERRRRRSRSAAAMRSLREAEERSEWWVVDGEMHEIGENVAPRERFVIPRDNLPNRRRKQMREQFMRRTRLVLKESEHEPWCKRYIELYQELRENWERLYWDEGYSKKLAQDHANYESAEDDDLDFSPYSFHCYAAGEGGPMLSKSRTKVLLEPNKAILGKRSGKFVINLNMIGREECERKHLPL